MPLISYSILRSSSVQTYLTQKIAAYLSRELKTEIEVGGVDITFFLNIVLEDVVIKDMHHRRMLDAKILKLKISKINFGKKLLIISNAKLSNTFIGIKKYQGEKNFNFQFLVNYFKSSDTTTVKKAWILKCKSFELINSDFAFLNENKMTGAKTEGFDINDFLLKELNLKVNEIVFNKDTIQAEIQKLSLKDKSGFTINHFKTNFKIFPKQIKLENLSIVTPHSDLAFALELKFENLLDFNDFVNKIYIHSTILPSKISLKDITYFAPDIKGMNDHFEISGELKGKVNSFKAKSLELNYGESTQLLGDLSVTGLPDIDETFIHTNIKNFTINLHDIRKIKLPNSYGYEHPDIPDNFYQLGNIRIKGLFTGFWYDFVSNGSFDTDLGELSTNISFKRNKDNKTLEGNGNLFASNFDVGKLFSAENILGKTSFHTEISGSGFYPLSRTSVHMEGVVDSITIKGYTYKNITLNGDLIHEKFSGDVSLSDENIQADFSGIVDYSGSLPVYDFSSTIKNAKLDQLNILKKDTIKELSANLKINFTGKKIDDLEGEISIKNTDYTEGKKKYDLKNLNILFLKDDYHFRNIKLRSDYANADINGKFLFSDLKKSFNQFFANYLPSLLKDKNEKQIENTASPMNITYSFNLLNPQPVCDLFFPKLKIAPNTIVTGDINTSTHKFDFKGNSSSFQFGGNIFNNLNIVGYSTDKFISIKIISDRLAIAENILCDNFSAETMIKNDSIAYGINWDDYKEILKNSGDIKGLVKIVNKNRFEFTLTDSKAIINDSIWRIGNDNFIAIDTSAIEFRNLSVGTKNQQLILNGIISKNPNDKFNISFHNVNLSNFDQLTNKKKVDFDGMANGALTLSDLYNSPNFISNLTIKDFAFNGGFLGDAVLNSAWDREKQGLAVNLETNYEENSITNKPIIASGYFYPDRISDNFDINIDLTNFNLKSIARYLSTFSSQLTGFATGKAMFKGSTFHPELSGKVKVNVKTLKIDYLNTGYSFNDDVTITKNSFEFNNIVLNDVNGRKATVNGKVTHENFHDWNLDLKVNADKFLCMNTTQVLNNIYYGKGIITGKAKIYGPTDNIFFEINAKTEKGTSIAIPYGTKGNLTESNFITFVKKDTAKIVEEIKEIDLSGIGMDFNLEITPDAEVQIIFDEKIGDVIKGSGSGNLEFKIDPAGEFNMFGEFDIQKGDYLFTLKNLINKKFEIENGGTIVWNGDPYDAYVDLKAKYKLRAPLYDLISSVIEDSSSIAKYKKRYQVECILGLQNKLFKPDISVDINLPNIDEQTQRYVEMFINVEDQQEMNKQLLALLVLNQFVQPSNNLAGMGYQASTTTSTELLFSQLSNWLSKLTGDLDVGVNYRPANKLTTQEMEVALSKAFFNDRILIDGNIGTPLESSKSSSSSNIVGDVNIEYKLPPDGKFRLKAYNKSNQDDLLKDVYSPYTQGLGIFYRKNFDKLKDLFVKKKQDEDKAKQKDDKNKKD